MCAGRIKREVIRSRFLLLRGGYPAIILDRPAFYAVLLKNLPTEKIFYGKRVTTIEQNDSSATVRCADGRYVLALAVCFALEPVSVQ